MLMAALHKTWNTFSAPNIFQTLNKHRVMLIWQFTFHEVTHLMEIKITAGALCNPHLLQRFV